MSSQAVCTETCPDDNFQLAYQSMAGAVVLQRAIGEGASRFLSTGYWFRILVLANNTSHGKVNI